MVLHQSFPSARLVEAVTPEAAVIAPEVGVTAPGAAVVVIGVVGEEIAERSEVVDAEVTSEVTSEVVEVVVEVVDLPGRQDRESSRMFTTVRLCDQR